MGHHTCGRKHVCDNRWKAGVRAVPAGRKVILGFALIARSRTTPLIVTLPESKAGDEP
jgi:hypothetical protein